jgi:hypothetical protein
LTYIIPLDSIRKITLAYFTTTSNEGTVNGMWTDPTYALRDVAARQAAIARDVAAWRIEASARASVPAAGVGDVNVSEHWPSKFRCVIRAFTHN